MPELDLSKEINIAIKAALASGKYLKKNKIELNKTSSSAPRDIKLDADIASSLMSINAVKGVNIGAGINSAQLSGEQNSDEIFRKGKNIKFNSNNAGGILGGISTGQEIIASFAVKPTSSILTTRKTINKFGKNTLISVRGRHDPCVGIRAVPIGEAMMSCVLLDHYLMNKAQCG